MSEGIVKQCPHCGSDRLQDFGDETLFCLSCERTTSLSEENGRSVDPKRLTDKNCPTCGTQLLTSIDYHYGHKTADGYVCENDDCREGWFDWGEV